MGKLGHCAQRKMVISYITLSTLARHFQRSVLMFRGAFGRGYVGDSLQTTAIIGCTFQLAVVGDIFPPVSEFWGIWW